MSEPISNQSKSSKTHGPPEESLESPKPLCPACQPARNAGASFCPQCGDQLTTPVHVDHAVETPLAQARPAEDIASGQRLPNQAADQDAASKLTPSLAPNVLKQTESRAIAPQGNVTQAMLRDVHFCSQCGAKANANDQEGYWLSHQGAKGESNSIQLIGQQLTIGKAPECDLVIPDDDYLSRRHARLLQKEGKFFLEDLASSNGTFLKVRRSIELEVGDEILIGSGMFRLVKGTS